MNEFIAIFGAPYQIHSDQGRNFESKLFTELCRLLDIEKTRTSAYRPQSGGFIERQIKTIRDILSKYIDWSDHVGHLMAAYRATPKKQLG